MQNIVTVLGILFFLIHAAVAQNLAKDKEPLRIAGLFVLTGQYAMQGAAFREGAELAVADVNAKGGISGHTLELRLEDTSNIPTHALTGARRLLQSYKPIAALTTSYPELVTGAIEFQKNRVPVVHLWDANPEIEAMGDYIFGIGPWTPSAGDVSARCAYTRLGARKAVIVFTNDPYSELVSGYFRAEFIKLGGQVLQTFNFNPQDNDFRAAFTKLRTLSPDVIYTPITDNVVPFYAQLKQAKISALTLTSDIIAEEHIQQSPASFDKIYQSQIRDPSGAPIQKLAEAYQRHFAKRMTLPWYVATAYDSVQLIAHCARQQTGKPDPVKIRNCIAATKGFNGASQVLTFNEGGSSPQIASMFQIRDRKFEFFWDDSLKSAAF
jgi:branched-chain amino acid transport system substrate-binding protein